jgi:hypothetical protein
MSNLTAVVDPKDMREIYSLFAKAEKLGINATDRLISQTIIHAAASAANATKPRKGRNKSGNIRGGKLLKRDTTRPIVKMPESMGYWYIKKDSKRNRPFKAKKKLSRTEVRRQGLRRVTKGIKKIEKGRWTYIPYDGKAKSNDKRLRIPYAGLAKEAWKRGFKKLGGKGSIATLQRNRRSGRVYSTKRKLLYAELTNLVSYVSKSSPGAARYGLNRARKKMQYNYSKEIEKKLAKELKNK